MSTNDSRFWAGVEPNISAGQDSGALRRSFGVFEVSRGAMFLLAAQEILGDVLGFRRSAETRRAALGDGTPIPLMSYGLVEYLMGLDLSGADLLELGGGQSTLFWSARTRSVCTIEHDPHWAKELGAAALSNVTLHLVGADDYVARLRDLDGAYDIIVLDCAANRYECARIVAERLRSGGMLILDNSDWYPNTAAFLRARELIQVDFPDFRPDHQYRCTTSVFLDPAFRPAPAGARLPLPPLGGKDIAATNDWDRPEPA